MTMEYGRADEWRGRLSLNKSAPVFAAPSGAFTSGAAVKTPPEPAGELASRAVETADDLIRRATRETASDIHIEPTADEVRVRFRVDGLLRPVCSFPLSAHAALISRIKIMSALDIAEKRLPQDGRMVWREEGKSVDFRVSSIPTIFGEKLVLRVLDRDPALLRLEKLGLSEGNLRAFRAICRHSCGMILATGPAGSGKTTTLYSVLTALNTEQKNIVTIEDPVEYRLAGVNQMQVHAKAGLTFAKGLRAILRQDPDVVMIGEIRDGETAAVGVRAALTGHLVLSTLHTNDAAGAVVRLLDMGVEPFLAAASLAGVLAQRLVRRICPDCKERYAATPDFVPPGHSAPRPLLYRGRGCLSCGGTGYRGRVAIHEILPIDGRLRELIRRGGNGDALKKAAAESGFRSLYEDGLEKALLGETTLEEVRRVVRTDG